MRRFRAAVALVALALLWSSWLVGTAAGQSQTCYYPDGQETTALNPCNASLPATNCCKDSDVCLKNGLCFSPGLGSVVRRGCTDKLWNSTECAGICSSSEFASSDVVLTPCGEYGSFCCGQNMAARACCDSNNGTEQVGTGEVLTSSLGLAQTATASFSPTASPTSSGTKDTATLSPDAKCKQSTWERATIALGVLLGCALAGFVAFVLWYKKKVGTRIAELNTQIVVLKARGPGPAE